MPKLALRLLLTAALTWAVGAAYTIWLNPELKFLIAAAKIKQAYAHRLSQEHGAKYLLFGGSSGMFSIDGERMLSSHGLPVVNMSLYAGCGPKIIAEWTLDEAKPGDTLIVALEPFLLAGEVEPTAIGTQFCWAMRSPHWLRGNLDPKLPGGGDTLLSLRPGAYHAFTLIGKIVRGQRLYRYVVADIHPSGWVETAEHSPFGSSEEAKGVSPGVQTFFRSLNAWSQARQIRVCYVLPMEWSSPDRIHSLQRSHARLLLEVSRFLPVLEDRRLGASTDLSLFADTNLHLNTNGVALRTDELAAALKAWRMWNPEELRSIATNGLGSSTTR